MVTDPYKVLGISRDATEDEIKKAYRKRAKECHPDLHPDDPHAQEKMNEVNEAYDMLKNPDKYRQQTYGGYSNNQSYYQQGNQTYTNFYDFFGFNQGMSIPMPNYESGDSQEIQDIVTLIRSQNYQNAYVRLQRIPQSYYNARWYYLYALCCVGMGYRSQAFEAIKRSVQMEPGRQEYENVYNILSMQQRTTYQNPFMYQRTFYRRGHSLLYYFFMIQLFFWLMQIVFGILGGGRVQSYDRNAYYDSPATQYEQSQQSSGFD